MTTTLIGTLESRLPQQVTTRMEREVSFKFRARNWRVTTYIWAGCADVISWTRSLISPGRFTSTWRRQTSPSVSWISLPTSAIEWVSSISRLRLLMFSRDSILTLNSGRAKEGLLLASSKWLSRGSSRRRDSSRLFRCSRILITRRSSISFRSWRSGARRMASNSDLYFYDDQIYSIKSSRALISLSIWSFIMLDFSSCWKCFYCDF